MRWLFVCFALTACTRPLDTPESKVDCSMLTDQHDCVAAGCAYVTSGCGCPGEVAVATCTEKAGVATPTVCTDGCATAGPTCESLTTSDACTARSDCWALLTFDNSCSIDGCVSRFSACKSGTPTCDEPTCPEPTGVSCAPGDDFVYEAGQCAVGCVAANRCAHD